jgi:hypothetical protein
MAHRDRLFELGREEIGEQETQQTNASDILKLIRKARREMEALEPVPVTVRSDSENKLELEAIR